MVWSLSTWLGKIDTSYRRRIMSGQQQHFGIITLVAESPLMRNKFAMRFSDDPGRRAVSKNIKTTDDVV
jgi:hypothetical protein